MCHYSSRDNVITVLEQIWPQRAPRLGGGPTLGPVLEDTLPDLVHDLDVHFMVEHPYKSPVRRANAVVWQYAVEINECRQANWRLEGRNK